MKTKRKVKAITPARPGQAWQSAARSVSAASRQPVGSQSGPSKPQFAATAAHDSAGAAVRSRTASSKKRTKSSVRSSTAEQEAAGGNVAEDGVRRQQFGAAVDVVQEEVSRLGREPGAEDEDGAAEQLV